MKTAGSPLTDLVVSAAETAFIMQNVFHLVGQLGTQLSSQGYPPPVLWWLLHCAARTVEHGLIEVTEKAPADEQEKYRAMLATARARLPEFWAVVDQDVKTRIPLSDAEQECAEWKLWALAELGRPELDGAAFKALNVSDLRRALEHAHKDG